ncbi:hypothetical protein LTR78_002646 [Recurvomyces mirabilis]|uniref:Uncharacterized protein n=1 Tax=Recurvomyces mirabilis TaxID=574656 RepID=A0AAE0WTE7_9PEZI|nr:hypothetical protein LTR78_002646 [Recurvomyces mirabilis]KAK5157575.1 hypothetical protein LTS14_004340 [Recurvomyces mirabilis]
MAQPLLDLQLQNAALTTELRLVKRQLAEAQTATAHLVGIIGKQQIQTQHDVSDHLRAQLQSTRAETVRLEGLLRQRRLLDLNRPAFALDDPFVDRAGPVQRYPSTRSPSRVGPEIHSEVSWAGRHDLLSFEGDGPGRAGDGWVAASRDGGLGVDTSSISTPPASGKSGGSLAMGDYRLPKSGFHTVEGRVVDESRSHIGQEHVQQTDLVDLDELDLVDAPKRTHAQHCFTQWERSYLLGIACFLEDLDSEDYTQKWVDVAKRRGRHSPEEWQEYYEKEIRPVYKAKQAAAMVDRSFSEEGGITSKDVEHLLPVETVGDDRAAGHEILGPATTATANVLVPVIEMTESAARDSGCPGLDSLPASKHDSPRAKTTPSASETLAPSHGLMASRWAPQVKAGLVVQPEPNSHRDVTTPVHSTTQHIELLSVDDFCEELNKQSESARGSHSFAPKPAVPGFIEVGEGKTCERDSGPDVHDSTTSSFSEAESTSITSRHVDRPDNRPARCNFSSDRDTRPGCCHWPRDDQQLLHSNFSHNPSTMRTAVISNIPPGASLADVLDMVRGGKIISAEYLPLSQMRTKPMMAMNAAVVTFLYADVAHAYAEFCRKNKVFLEVKDGSEPSRIKVMHIKTPIRPPISFGISPQERPSRVLYLNDDGSKTAEQVTTMVSKTLEQRTIPSYFTLPLRTGKNDDGLLFFEFASIEDAIITKQAMESLHWDLGGAGKGFLPDPCERPLQSLLGGVSENRSSDTTLSETAEASNPGLSDREDDVVTVRRSGGDLQYAHCTGGQGRSQLEQLR